MFGIEPQLQCVNCAHGIRERMQVRVRNSIRDRKPIVTFALIGIAAAIYLLEAIAGPNEGMSAWMRELEFYLLEGPRIWDGEVWPLVASAFFHGGLLHIGFNCWWMWDLGRAVEWGFGRWQMAALVIGSAAVSGAAQWVNTGPGIGLSGVVYAVAGFLYVHRKTNPIAAVVLNERTARFLATWFVICIVITQLGMFPIGNWAHGFGALFGLAAGWASLHKKRRMYVPLLAAVTIALIVATPFLNFGSQAEAHRLDRAYKESGADDLQRWNQYIGFLRAQRTKE